MASMAVEFAGLRFKNPILIASCSLTGNLSKMLKLEAAGAAGLVSKMVTHATPPDNYPFQGVVAKGGWASYGDKRLNLEEGVALLKASKKELKIPIIANIMGRAAEEESWALTAKAMERAGADGVELNLSCPHVEGISGALPHYPGLSIGCSPGYSAQVTAAVKAAVRVPVICKLTPEASDLTAVALACREAGADGLSAINAVIGLPGVDIEKGGRPLYPGLEAQPYSGLTGEWIKPIALRYTASLAAGVDLPLSSVGGVMTWRDVVERLMLGARTVQLCSTVYFNGYRRVESCLRGLNRFMKKQGYGSVKEMLGLALKYLVPRSQMVRQEMVAELIEERCNGCWLCLERLAGCDALFKKGARVALKVEDCTGCNLCVTICPTRAFRMKSRG